jgi:hypothetical protein
VTLWRRDVRLPSIARPDAIAVALLAVLVAGVFHDVTLGGRVLYERDAHHYLYPHLESLVQVVSEGSWPLWNPYFAFGEPMLANPQFQVFYPPTWLNVAARPWTWYTVMVLVHLTFSGAGTYALARRLGASRLAAWVGGAAWILSGPVLSLVNNHHHLTGAAWMPWVLLAADRAFGSPSTRGFVVFAATFGIQIVAGSPDTCAMTAVLCGLDFLRHRRRPLWSGANARTLAAAAGATALALGLSAAQWLPTMVVAARSTRPDLPDRLRTYWSMHPANVLQALVPISFHELPLSTSARAALFESREPFLMSLYLGVGTLALVAMAVVAGRPPARALALVALAAVLLAMGRHGAFYPALASVLPPLRMFRYPVKAMLPAALCWALLAAIGLDGWRRIEEMPRGRRRAVWAMAAFALAIGVAMALLAMGHVPGWLARSFTTDPSAPSLTVLLAPALRRTVPAMLLALAIVAAGLAIRVRPALGVAVMGLAAVADLALAHAGLNRTCPPEMMAARPPALAYVKWDGSRVYSYDEFIPSRGSEPPPHAPYTLAQPSPDERAIAALGLRMALYPSILGLWRVENSYDFDQLQLFPKPIGALPAFLRIVEGTPTHLRLLQMGAVSRVFALHAGGLEALTPITTLPTLFTEPCGVCRAGPAAACVHGRGRPHRGRRCRLGGPQRSRVRSVPGGDPARRQGGTAGPVRRTLARARAQARSPHVRDRRRRPWLPRDGRRLRCGVAGARRRNPHTRVAREHRLPRDRRPRRPPCRHLHVSARRGRRGTGGVRPERPGRTGHRTEVPGRAHGNRDAPHGCDTAGGCFGVTSAAAPVPDPRPAWRRPIALPRLPASADSRALAGLAAIVAALCWPVVAHGQVYWERDLHLYLYPHAEAFVRVLARGSLPLWNPYVALGEPLLANPQLQVFYPPTWLHVLMTPWTWFAAFVVVHLLFTAAGAYVLARRLQISSPGAFLAAAVWITSGPLLSAVNLYHHFAGAAWIPWVVAASDSALATRRAREVLACGAALALQITAGSADMCALAMFLAAANALRHVEWDALRGRGNPRLVLAGILSLVLGAGLSAAQWIPTLEMASRSSRSDQPERIRTYWSVHPAALAQAVIPVPLHELPLSNAVRTTLFESREPLLVSLYLGLAAAVLVLAAIVEARPARAIAALLVLIVVVALGRHTPAFALAGTR